MGAERGEWGEEWGGQEREGSPVTQAVWSGAHTGVSLFGCHAAMVWWERRWKLSCGGIGEGKLRGREGDYIIDRFGGGLMSVFDLTPRLPDTEARISPGCAQKIKNIQKLV